MTTTPVIEVERLNVSYGDFHAVKDLSFQVRRGELYALLGTNGARTRRSPSRCTETCSGQAVSAR